MAKAYQVKHDLTLARVLSISGEGDDAEYTTESVTYPTGSFVRAESLTPRDQKRLEEGELDQLVEPVSDEQADQIPAGDPGEPEFGVFVPEHEMEAHVLEQYGHQVVPKDQEMELLSSSEEYSRNYQQQVKEAGLDARPNLEATNPENRQPIPDELLQGGATRSGLPHQRGVVMQQEEGDNGGDEGDEEEGATRPAPGQPPVQSSAQQAQPQKVGESGEGQKG